MKIYKLIYPGIDEHVLVIKSEKPPYHLKYWKTVTDEELKKIIDELKNKKLEIKQDE